MIKNLIPMTLATCITACTSGGQKEPALCRGAGERMQFEELTGAIYGNVGTKVTLASCGTTKMGLIFIGGSDERYLKLKHQAIQTESVVKFKATADGYLIKDAGRYIFIIITLDNVVEAPERPDAPH